MSAGLGLREGVVSEAILRSFLNIADVLHSAEALSFTLSGLESPVVRTDARVGVGAMTATTLLNVVGLVAAASAFVVDLSVAFTEALSSLSFTHI